MMRIPKHASKDTMWWAYTQSIQQGHVIAPIIMSPCVFGMNICIHNLSRCVVQCTRMCRCIFAMHRKMCIGLYISIGGDLALGLRGTKKSYHYRVQKFFEPNFRMTFFRPKFFYFSSQNS